jgi:uncharacterized protein (DUF1697 family)
LKTWIALLRGVNVLGNRKLPMKDLVSVLQRAGFDSVRTYIQSGNVVFQSSHGTARALSTQIAHLILKRVGFQPRVMVLSDRQLAQAISGNPFPKGADDPTSLHLFFLSERPKEPDLNSLAQAKTGTEGFVLKDAVFYLYTPEGFAKSALRSRVERCLGVDATARNWRTVNQLRDMARACHGPYR